MDCCELTSSITALAFSIAKDKSTGELNLLSAIFSQLGDTLDTIVACKSLNTQKAV